MERGEDPPTGASMNTAHTTLSLALPTQATFEAAFAPVTGSRAARDAHAALLSFPGRPSERILAAARWLQAERILGWTSRTDLAGHGELALVLPADRFAHTLVYRPAHRDIVVAQQAT